MNNFTRQQGQPRQRMKPRQSRYMDQADQAVDNIYKNVKMAHAFFREDAASTAQKSKKRRFFSGLFKVVTLGFFHVLAVTLSAIAYAVAVGNESRSNRKNTNRNPTFSDRRIVYPFTTSPYIPACREE